ncbi:hypothetical protein WNY79_10845 [Pseudoalteromonas sp. AS84]|uniref:hypothetical protein n=1 Tax=Pseudoalteromonas sp. AS84 TaxID=3135778 RepID=UPI003176DA43
MQTCSPLEKLVQSVESDFKDDSEVANQSKMRAYLRNFIKYVKEHPSTSYYPISKLFKASQCDSPSEVLQVTSYLTSDDVGFLSITFCYFPLDREDPIEISAEEYFYSKSKSEPPVDKVSGIEIVEFDPSRLGFYCNTKVNG